MVGLMLTVWLIISVHISGARADGKKSGPFQVELEKFTKCEDEETGIVVWGTKITRTSDGNRVYNNTIYYGHPVDKDFKIYLELQSFSNGVYSPRYMHHDFKGCVKIWRYFQGLYKRLELDGKKVEGCPVPTGNYSYSFDFKEDFITNVKSMIYNKYKGVFIFYYKGKKSGCINVYGEVVPKE